VVFNLLSNVGFLLDYTTQAVVGGIICIAFKIIGDICRYLEMLARLGYRGLADLVKAWITILAEFDA